ncbi:MAG: serine/threonine protein kinase [Planctomycetaceae bacterium]|nr:serine/threonine protein kinase [Planctomycetaceae bacterium]
MTETDESQTWWTRIAVRLGAASAAKEVRRVLSTDTHHGESESASLLRKRLRAVTLLLFLIRATFAVRQLLSDHMDLSTRHGVVIGCLAVLFVGLQRSPLLTSRRLRIVEVVLFLGFSVDSAMTLNERLAHIGNEMTHTEASHPAQVVELVAAIKDQVVASIGLMLIYGMFIPNSGRKAAPVVLLMATIPGLVVFGNRQSREELNSFRRRNAEAVEQLRGVNLLTLTIGAVCSIYGTVVINELRRRAINAEEMGQYQLRRKLGRGGMGDVYLAEHKLLRRLCALKVIRHDQATDPVMMGRFELEVRATASLTHWNTIQVFDYGQTDDGRFFYVMEYLKGRNLLEIVRHFGPMCAERTVFLLMQVCDALRESASRGLVHRDIKPSNVFLAALGERYDVVKLLDFGLVRPLKGMPNADTDGDHLIHGSPRYMCPEQAQGQVPDIRGDLYSLGAVAYFLLTGRPPFLLDNPVKLIVAHVSETPDSFQDLGVDVPDGLSRIVLRCLNKSPDDRYSSPDELQRDLRSLPEFQKWSWERGEQWWRMNLPALVAEADALHLQPHDAASPTDNAIEAALGPMDDPASSSVGFNDETVIDI